MTNEAKRAYMRAYNARNRDKKALQDKRYREAHPETRREQNKRYNARNAVKVREYCRVYRRKNNLQPPHRYDPVRRRAYRLVFEKVSAGLFPAANTQVCELCQEALADDYHHHKGYEGENALDVIAVCRQCHAQLHRSSI